MLVQLVTGANDGFIFSCRTVKYVTFNLMKGIVYGIHGTRIRAKGQRSIKITTIFSNLAKHKFRN